MPNAKQKLFLEMAFEAAGAESRSRGKQFPELPVYVYIATLGFLEETTISRHRSRKRSCLLSEEQ